MTNDVSPSPTTSPFDEVRGRELVEAWRVSGLSGAAYCRANGLRSQRLHYWRERLGYPIKLIGDSRRPSSDLESSQAVTGFIQIVGSSPANAVVDIVVGAVLIRVSPGFDVILLRSVVAALHGAA